MNTDKMATAKRVLVGVAKEVISVTKKRLDENLNLFEATEARRPNRFYEEHTTLSTLASTNNTYVETARGFLQLLLLLPVSASDDHFVVVGDGDDQEQNQLYPSVPVIDQPRDVRIWLATVIFDLQKENFVSLVEFAAVNFVLQSFTLDLLVEYGEGRKDRYGELINMWKYPSQLELFARELMKHSAGDHQLLDSAAYLSDIMKTTNTFLNKQVKKLPSGVCKKCVGFGSRLGPIVNCQECDFMENGDPTEVTMFRLGNIVPTTSLQDPALVGPDLLQSFKFNLQKELTAIPVPRTK